MQILSESNRISQFQVLRIFEKGLGPGQVSRMLCWDWSREEMVGWQVRALTGHSGTVLSVDFSADGKRIVSGSADSLVKIWEVETGAEVGRFVCVRALRVGM